MTKGKYLDIKIGSDRTEEISDNELVRIVRENDPDRYADVIKRYQSKLFSYIYRLIGNREEAEDLLQDVFLKAFRNLYNFDVSRKFSPWIYRIAHNESVNFIKRKYLKKFVSWEDVSSSKDKLEMNNNGERPDDAWIRKEENEKLNQAIDRMPLKYKQVLLLRFFSDRSYEEISEILEKPLNTVGTLINRAKKKLMEEINKEEKKHQKKIKLKMNE